MSQSFKTLRHSKMAITISRATASKQQMKDSRMRYLTLLINKASQEGIKKFQMDFKQQQLAVSNKTQKSTIVSSKEELQRNSGVSLKVPIPLPNLPSLSLGFKNNKVTKQVFENEKKMFERKVNEFHYDVDIVNVDDIRLNDLFRQDVNSLPLSITNRQDSQKYLSFIGKYGTHYVASCKMGASITSRFFYSKIIQGKQLQKGNKLSLEFYSIQIGKEEKYSQKFSGQKDDFQFQQKSKGKKGSKSYHQWKSQTQNLSLQPIEYTLDPIYNLLTYTKFPEMQKADIQLVSSLLKEYTFTTKYCFDLRSSSKIDYCDIYELMPSVQNTISMMMYGLNLFETLFIKNQLPKYQQSQNKVYSDFTFLQKKTISLGERQYKFPDQLQYQFVNYRDKQYDFNSYANGLIKIADILYQNNIFIQNANDIYARSTSSLAYNGLEQNQMIFLRGTVYPILKIKFKNGIQYSSDFSTDKSYTSRYCRANSQVQKANNFMKKYGTHQISQITLGGYFGTHIKLNDQQLSALEVYTNIKYKQFDSDIFLRQLGSFAKDYIKQFYSSYFVKQKNMIREWKSVSKFQPKIISFKLQQQFQTNCYWSLYRDKFSANSFYYSNEIKLPKPSCRICKTCGGKFSNKMGQFQAQYYNDQHFTKGYEKQCYNSYGSIYSLYLDICCQLDQKQTSIMACDSCSDEQSQLAQLKHDIQTDWGSQDFDFQTFSYNCNQNYYRTSDANYPWLCGPKQAYNVPCQICQSTCGGQFPIETGAVNAHDMEFVYQARGQNCQYNSKNIRKSVLCCRSQKVGEYFMQMKKMVE